MLNHGEVVHGQPVYAPNHQHRIGTIPHGPRLPDQLLQCAVKRRPFPTAQPELWVVGEAERSPPSVQVGVELSVVGLVPPIEGAIYTLHQVVHDATVGWVSNE